MGYDVEKLREAAGLSSDSEYTSSIEFPTHKCTSCGINMAGFDTPRSGIYRWCDNESCQTVTTWRRME